MPACAVVVCKNRSNIKLQGITFHRFPNEKNFKEKWINATGRGPDWFPTKQSTICSMHFEEQYFKSHTKIRKLFEWAVPTLRLRMVYATDNTNMTQNVQPPPAGIAVFGVPQIQNYIHILYNPAIDGTPRESPISIVNVPAIDETPREKRLEIELKKYKNVVKAQKKIINRLRVKTSRYKKKIIQLTCGSSTKTEYIPMKPDTCQFLEMELVT